MLVVNIDGCDAIGKSTLTDRLMAHYEKQGLKVNYLHFPRYNTKLGSVIFDVLKGNIKMEPFALQMLFTADRINWITYDLPEIEKNCDILFIDRFVSSTLVYGTFDGIPVDELLLISQRIFDNMPKNTINLILHASEKTIIERLEARNEETTMYEKIDTITQANEKYKKMHLCLDHLYYIDANGTKDDVFKYANTIVDFFMDDRNAYN